jgi:hypothetical protein
VCDFFGNICFFGFYKSAKVYEDCDCPSDCQAVKFTVSESSRSRFDEAIST